jgi:lipid II:glycine glycyltransferase (peptidoglycan interpeptide bridge formation enzyme)
VAEFLKSRTAAIIQFNLPTGVTDVQPYLWKGFKVSPAYTYQLDLNPAIEETFTGFDAKLRADISKAEKDGIVVKKTDDMGDVRSLVKKTLDRKTKDLSFSLIDKILFEFAKPKNSFAFVAYNADQPVAAAFCIYDGTTAYYLLGGFDHENRYRGAAASTIFASIQHARELGLQIFDFEGSMIRSIEAFFRGFGGELVPKYSVHRAWLPLEILLKFVKREIY